MIFNTYRMPADSSWFGNCCGATYVKKPTDKTKVSAAHKGIRIFDHQFGEEYQGKKQDVNHIKTRSGNLTVCIRHTY